MEMAERLKALTRERAMASLTACRARDRIAKCENLDKLERQNEWLKQLAEAYRKKLVAESDSDLKTPIRLDSRGS